MRFAAIADIHGNALALQAVLDDIKTQEITQIINLGDVFSGPIDAGGTAALLEKLDIPTVRGNHDRYLVEQKPEDMGPSDQVAYDRLSPKHLNWLRELPASLSIWDEVYACHATPSVDERYWMEQVEPGGVIRQSSLDELEAELDEEARKASLILCGHTHIPRIARLSSGAVLVNSGSVGCPAYTDVLPHPHVMQTGTPNASYAILEKNDGDWNVTFRSIPYDSRSAAAQARSNGREDWAKGLESGWL